MLFLVTGATGNVGGELVHALVDRGHTVRALTRRTHEPSAWPPGVEPATGDLDAPGTLTSALAGVDGVFLLPGYRDMPGLLAAIGRGGVARVVLLSGRSAASGDTSNAITAYMMRSEAAVQQAGLDWTVLRPSGFMSNTLSWRFELRESDTVTEPFASVPVAVIDPRDIAEVAAAALTQPGHHGRTYDLSGPESLRPADRVRTLGRVLNRHLTLWALSDHDARARMNADGVPTPYIEAFVDFYVHGSLDESAVLPTVTDLLGRPPRTFEQWAVAHAETFNVHNTAGTRA